MIKLQLPPKPAQLANEEERLTQEFKADKNKRVWAKDYIKEPLLKMSNNKCAYSEVAVNRESSYVEIDHFKHKNLYEDDVVKWGNLLPSCKKCNTSKGRWDVVKDPIVNPLFDNPSDHLYVECFRYYRKDLKGKNTLDAVDINNDTHFTLPRAEITFKIVAILETNYESLKLAITEQEKKKFVNKIKSALEDCGPSKEFSAVISTHILYENHILPEIENYLKDNYLWDDELEELKNAMIRIALPK